MCGIAGIIAAGASAPPIDSALLDRMRDLIAHRGPDDLGSYCAPDGRAGLASRRLSIIDLSPAGHMPMPNDDGSLWIAYNGEAYNFAEHRPLLEARGHVFRSRSDTEVILRLYQEFGPDCVHYLRGMFAFAIWDARKGELFMARDRLGVKPLYYAFVPAPHCRDGHFLFASEIKALLLHPGLPRAVDDEGFYHFLTFLTTPPPQTLFKGIFKLPAGHRATLGRDGELRVEEYWDVFDDARVEPGLSEDEYAERLLAKLRESVELRMVSDVPFGVLLSGGIDSSTNTALMAGMMDRPVQTFSIGYHQHESYNEFEFARQVAQRFGADHHETLIGASDFIEFLPRLIYHQDEPIADPVCVPVYFVCKLARESGTIVLQVGEGADELFGGYSHWMAALQLHRGWWQAYGALPRPVRQAALAAAPLQRDGLRYEYMRRGAAGEELFWGGAIAFGEARKRRLLAPGAARRAAGLNSHEVIQPYRRRFDERSPLRDYLLWMSYLDLRFRLPELLLMRVDKMSMATSVEARVPFLDHEFVALAMSIPQKAKLNGGHPKHLLKRAVRGLIPDEIVDRPKQGFRVPVEEWLAESLGAFTRDKLRAFCARTDYFRWEHVEQMLARRDNLAWYLLNFAMWHERWIEGSGGN